MIKDPIVFVKHILESINKIETFTKGVSESVFLKDIKLQDAVVRRLEIIGEAVKNIPTNFRNKYKTVPWQEIAGMRDKLTHHYFGVDMKTVWKVLREDLPSLKINIIKILKEQK